MSLAINTNIPSLTAQRNLGLNNDMLSKSLERLSSGLRVNRSSDDAAGLSIATKLSMQSRGLRVAVRNAGDAGSLVNTAEGAFNVATNIIGRLRELAVQSASDTNTSSDRATLAGESNLLVAELNRLASTTEFNGASLLDGSFASGKVQVGANADQTISFSLGDVRAAQLGKFAAFSVNIADGIGNASGTGSTFSGFGNLTTGEFTVNGQLTGATAVTDDQVSVLELFYKNNLGTSLALGDGTPAFSGVTASNGASVMNSAVYSTAASVGLSSATISGVASAAISGAGAATSMVEVISTALSNGMAAALSYAVSNGAAPLSAAIAAGASVAAAAAGTASTGAAAYSAAAYSALTSILTSTTGSGVTSGAASGATSATTSAGGVNIAFTLARGTGALYINGTAITSLANNDGASAFAGISAAYTTNSSYVSAFVAKINAAGITNVTARQAADGSTYTLVAAKGVDIKLAFSNAVALSVGSILSNVGLVSQVVGSGNATTEVSTYNGQAGAISKAAAINSVKGKSGVTAVAVANVYSQATAITAGNLAANGLTINGYAIDATTGITAGDGTGVLRAAINAKTGNTGVTASVTTGGALVLTANDGRNISLVASEGAATITAANSGVNLYRGAIKLTSQSDVSFSGATTDIGSASTATPYTADLTNSVSVMDITTQAGANTAIMTLDAALAQISKVRSDVGALQSRLDLTTQALTVSAENQEAAAARIKDADFAYETAQFTRNQILVQAGTAILAQANKTGETALQLLR
ncbi:MAG: flagellin [Nitrospirae bacterium]|nr:flagellin [Nitrospirota bacterium]